MDILKMLLAVLVLAVISCSDSHENKGDAVVAVKNNKPLTEEFLFGGWCHQYSQTGEAKTPVNMDWTLEKGGKFYKQTSSLQKKLKHFGNWGIVDGKLNLGAAMMGGGANKVSILSHNEFILYFFLEHHIVRGKCV